MNPIPFNLSALKTGSFLQLDPSEKFLVSKAGSVHTEWKLPASKPGKVIKPSLVQTLAFGDVSLAWTSTWVTVTAKSKAQWGINTARFSAKPTLRVSVGRDGKTVRIALKAARFPGFDLSADLVATLTLKGQATTISFKFPFCGFVTEDIPLVGWLEGAAPAKALVFFDDFICRVTTGLHLRLAGVTWATFNPSWLFVFGGGQPFVDLTAEGDTISSPTLALALLAPGMPSVLPLPANRRAALFIPEKTPFDMPLWPERASGWRFLHPAPAFSQLFIEADEQLDGAVRRAVTAVGAAGSTIFFEPGADLLNDFMTPFSIPLLKPLYVAAYSGDGARLGATLLASRVNIPLTAHTAGCTLYLGAVPRKPGFMLTDIPSSDSIPGLLFLGPPNEPLQQGLPFSLIATAPRMGDFVVDPMPPLAPSTMLLALSPIGRELTPAEGMIAVSDKKPEAHILLPDWILTQIVRPRDLMVIGLQFLGLRPAFSGSRTGRLLRSSADAPRIIVYFPPQSMGEQSFNETEFTTDNSVDPPPINYRISGLSRLAFDLPDNTNEIAYTPDELLNWKDGILIPRLDNRAITQEDAPSEISIAVRPRPGSFKIHLSDGWFVPVTTVERSIILPKAPALDTTAIEAPYRLLLSPDQYGHWDSAVSAAMSAGSRAVLWHTRLGTKASIESPLVRAIWSVDKTPGISKDPFGEHTTLTPGDRDLIVHNCAMKAVDARQMMLTSLGAWLNLDGNWTELPDDLVTLEKWIQRSTLGRDQFVQVVKRGYLYPFGHKAVMIEITERKFGQKPTGYVGAWLRTRRFIVVKELERNYKEDQDNHGVFEHERREIPFKSVRVLTKVTRLLEEPVLIDGITIPPLTPGDAGATDAAEEGAFWPMVGNEDFMFHLNATDRAGNIVEFSAPLAFVRNDVSRNPANIALVVADQLTKGKDIRRMYAFGGQKFFFADPKMKDDNKTIDDEALEAVSIGFEGFVSTVTSTAAWHRPFYPKMTTANVVVPAMRQFAGISSANVISYYKTYLEHGFDNQNKNGEIYVKFDKGVSVTYGSDNKTDKAGGIISPGMLAGGLSRAHGPVGVTSTGDDPLNNYASGVFDPKAFFGGMSAKILGGLDLFDILVPNLPFSTSGVQKIPQWINEATTDGSIARRFVWKTDQLLADAGSFTSGAGKSLEVDCQVTVKSQSGSPEIKTRVNAVMKKFDITLAEVIKISFNEFSMLVESGSKPKVNVDITDVSFEGGLSFVSAIAEALHLDSFADGSGIDVSPEGVSLSYGLQLPSIQLGVLALRNLALNASATLPFIGDPFRARFALSERQNPFSISVSFFTGGGFFAIGVGLDGVEMVEVSLEFGGNFSLDIGVASGGVHAMAGIYIKYLSTATESYTELTGYVRLGGSLSVLGLIGISVEFYLSLSYVNQNGHKKAWGEASMTVEISILFFSIDVELKVRREFAGDSADPVFGDTFSRDDWNSYLEAFAA